MSYSNICVSDLSVSKICKELQNLNLVFSVGTMTETQQEQQKPKKSFTFKKDWQKKTIKDCNHKLITKDDNTIALHTGTDNNIIAIDWDLYDYDIDEGDFVLNREKMTCYNEIISNHDITTFTEISGNNGVHWIYKYDPIKTGGIIKGGKLVFKNNSLNCGDLKVGGGCIFFSGSSYKGVNDDDKKYTTENTTINIEEIPTEILNYFTYEIEGKADKKEKIIIENTDVDVVISTPVIIEKFVKTKNIKTDSDFLNVWLSCLDYNNYDEWINVLHSVKNNTEHWKLVHQWASQCSNYKYSETQAIIEKGTGVKSIGSIYYSAKKTKNYKTAFDSIEDDLDFLEMINVFNNRNLSGYYYKFHKYEYLYKQETKIGTWFMLNNLNIWEKTNNETPAKFKLSIMNFIIDKIETQIKLLRLKIKNMTEDDVEKGLKARYTKHISEYNVVIKKVGSVGVIKGAIEMLKELYTNNDITKILLEQTVNINKLCFLNGYINLNEKAPYKLHEIQATDYIMITTNYNYNPKPSKIKYVNEILDKIATDKHKEYLLSVIAKSMFGQNKNRHFYIFTGSGANGKSMLCADLIKPALGSYYKELDPSYYTQATRTGAPTPEMANTEYTRLLVASEPEASEKLQSAKIKGLTGLEPISSRAMYKETQSWTPHFTPILLCNEKPDFNRFDKAIAQRVKIIPFTSKFVDNPTLSFEYLLNVNLKSELNDDKDESIRQSFISILLEHYDNKITINDDEISLEATKEFIDSQNPLNDFINTHLIKDNAENVVFNNVYECYKSYYECGGFDKGKMLSKTTFSTCLKMNNIEVKKCGVKNVSFILYNKLVI